MDFTTLASKASIAKTIIALKANGIDALVVENTTAARDQVLKMLPSGAEVMTMSSETLRQTGLAAEINETDRFNSVRKKLATMNRETQHLEMNKIGGAPDYAIGSAQAVTQDGKLLIASNTGSQLGAYSYGSPHVIFVVGTQKIVPDLDSGIKRIYDYILPLESDRLSKAVGKPISSFVSKLLIINREMTPNRITVIFAKEKLGF